MKRIGAFIIIAIVLLLFACNSNNSNVTEENKTIKEDKEMTEQVKTFTEPLAVWVWQNADGSEEDTMIIRFYKDKAPVHVENFIKLSMSGFYNGNKIFRVVPGFVIQTGSPTDDNMGGPGYTIDAEFNDIKHLRGTLAMARAMDPNSAGSQYYFTFKATPHLDNKYTVFGQIIENVDLMDKIKIGDYVKEVKIIEASEYYGEHYKDSIEAKDIHNK